MIRLVGVTSGSSLKIFLRLAEMLRHRMQITTAGLFAADSLYYSSQKISEATIIDSFEHLLFEWDITREAIRKQPLSESELIQLRSWEIKYGDPVFWNALIADRRIYFGKKVKYRQDYPARFSYKQMLCLLYVFLEKIESFFDQSKPDIVFSFGTATIGEYIFFLVARSRGIGFLQLKGTKIGNYVSLNSDAIDFSHHFRESYSAPGSLSVESLVKADEYIAQTKSSGLTYEGAIQLKKKLSLRRNLVELGAGFKGLMGRQTDPTARHDNHVENYLMMSIYNVVVNPLRAVLIDARINDRYIDPKRLGSIGAYAFYPMHFEPEVAIQIYGRPFQNQIELIRAISLALPAGMLLVVKEHPRSRGFRSWSYYEKLLNIPNVRLVKTEVQTRIVIERAALVAVLSGSTGLEAAICGKPVITFGIPIINALPKGIIRHIGNMNNLAFDIKDMMSKYQYDEEPLRKFVASIIQGSVPVDLYTTLLQKPGRQRLGRREVSEGERRKADYEALANYCVARIHEEIHRTGL